MVNPGVLSGRGKNRQRAVAALVGLLAGAGIWGWGLVWFAGSIPRTVADPDRETDAIVVLTGGSLRLETGFELLSRRLAKKLFVSGVRRGVQIEELLRVTGLTAEDMECCITLGYKAGDTGENARESASWLKANDIRSIRLVTSGYHMPRSLLEFSGTVPAVEIVPHPVFAEHVMLDEWWRRPGTAGLVMAEYNKYLLAAVRHGLGGGAGE